MKSGMLWLDDDKKRTLEEKVQRAADYYLDKYGRIPELCLVHLSSLEDIVHVGSIEVRPASNVLPSHFWLGIETMVN